MNSSIQNSANSKRNTDIYMEAAITIIFLSIIVFSLWVFLLS